MLKVILKGAWRGFLIAMLIVFTFGFHRAAVEIKEEGTLRNLHVEVCEKYMTNSFIIVYKSQDGMYISNYVTPEKYASTNIGDKCVFEEYHTKNADGYAVGMVFSITLFVCLIWRVCEFVSWLMNYGITDFQFEYHKWKRKKQSKNDRQQ